LAVRDTDKQNFAKLMTATMAVYEKTVNPDVIGIWWNALCAYEFDDVKNAFSAHIKRGEFAPRPASIIAILDTLHPDGRLSADEAWAMIPRDEASSVVMTDEMAEAFGIAKPLLDARDQIAARMAFKSAYERIVEAHRVAGIAPKWFPSLGHDKAGRDMVISEAVRMGRLGVEHAKLLAVNNETLLALGDKSFSVDQAKANIAKIKAMLQSKSIPVEAEKIEKAA
jgi:hypothetical protein